MNAYCNLFLKTGFFSYFFFFLVIGCLSDTNFAISNNPYVSRSHDYIFKKIQRNKEIKIAVSNNYPPLGFEGKGIEFDMAKSLAKFLNVRVKIIFYELSNVIEAVEKNKIDIAIAGLSRSLDRANRVWFSVNYLNIKASALIQKRLLPKNQFGEFFENRSIKDLSDINKLNSIRLLIHKNSIYEDLFSSLVKIKFNKLNDGLNMLLNNKGNALLHDSLYLRYKLKHRADIRNKYIFLIEESDQGSLCVALPFGDIVLKNQVDTWILENKKKIQKWVNQYFQ